MNASFGLVLIAASAWVLYTGVQAKGNLLRAADDVADHATYASRFGCERVLHARDVGPDTRAVEPARLRSSWATWPGAS